MEKEIEVKFKIADSFKILDMLRKAGARHIDGPYKQVTIGFFSVDSIKKGIFPRIRNEKKNIVLTVKVKKVQQVGYKEREEYSILLKNIKQGEDILFALGYVHKRNFTKVRQDWSLLNTKITIDKLYFGKYVEIEGEKENIEKVIDVLGFKKMKRITKSYLGLEDEYIKKSTR